MKANQIYTLLNDVQKEAFGEQAIAVKDTSTLVSLGEYVFSSENEDNLDAFYRQLIDKIGRTYIKYREYYSDRFRGIERTPLEFGAVLQKVQIHKIAKAKENSAFKNQTGYYTLEKDDTDFTSQLFSKWATWSVDKVIYDYQMRSAFENEKNMGAFVNLIFQDMYNAMEVELENTSNLAIATAIASCFKVEKTNRNILAEYKALYPDSTLTKATCMTDVNFLKYLTMQLDLLITRMGKMSSLFNSAGADRFSRKEELRVDILSNLASSSATYLQADTFHKELVALPNYEEVVYWQGSGTDYSFDECSKIHITDESGTTIEKSGIVAFIYDREKVATCIEHFRTKSMYNPKHELTNYWHKADLGYMVDETENGVVFYIEDEVDEEEA